MLWINLFAFISFWIRYTLSVIFLGSITRPFKQTRPRLLPRLVSKSRSASLRELTTPNAHHTLAQDT